MYQICIKWPLGIGCSVDENIFLNMTYSCHDFMIYLSYQQADGRTRQWEYCVYIRVFRNHLRMKEG